MFLIVDAQYDFIEGGSLQVGGSKNAMDNLVEYIIKHGKEYASVVLTADWHPQTHMSFKDNGGEWPKHCIQHSHGAAIYNPILKILGNMGVPYTILTKGCNEDREEYSIFKNPTSKEYLKNLNNSQGFDTIDVCGLAGDICVLNTIKDGLIEFPNATFNVLKDYAPSLDGGKTLTDFINKNERVLCQE